MIKRIILLLFIYSSIVFCQTKIVGTWQAADTLVAAGLKDSYRFFSNGNFEYRVSTFNNLSKLSCIKGEYKIEYNNIIFTVKKIVELIDGELSFGDESTDFNNWDYINEREVDVSLIKPKIFKVRFDYLVKSKSIKIDYKEFFKLSDDPKAYSE